MLRVRKRDAEYWSAKKKKLYIVPVGGIDFLYLSNPNHKSRKKGTGIKYAVLHITCYAMAIKDEVGKNNIISGCLFS